MSHSSHPEDIGLFDDCKARFEGTYIQGLDEPLTAFMEAYFHMDAWRFKLASTISDRLEKIPSEDYAWAFDTVKFRGGQANYDHIGDPYSGTFDWIFQESEDGKGKFASWLNIPPRKDTQRIFWITGDHGTGKSVLMKHILQQIEKNPSVLQASNNRSEPKLPDTNQSGSTPSETKSEQSPVVLGCFKDDRRFGPEEHDYSLSHREITLPQLLRQCPAYVSGSFIKAYFTKFAIKDRLKSVWGQALIIHTWDFSMKRIQEKNHPMYVFLDGHELNDKYCPAINRPDRMDICKEWGNAKLCMASRPRGAFHYWWQPFHQKLIHEDQEGKRSRTMFLQEHTGKDITLFCATELKGKIDLAYPIAKKCENSFIAARVTMAREQLINPKKTPLEISEATLNDMVEQLDRALPWGDDGLKARGLFMQELSFFLSLIVKHEERHCRLSLWKLAQCAYKLAGNQSTGHPTRDKLNDANILRGMARRIELAFYPFVVIRGVASKPAQSRSLGQDSLMGNVTHEGEYNTIEKADYTFERAAAMEVGFIHPEMCWVLQNTAKGKQLLSLHQLPEAEDELEETITRIFGETEVFPYPARETFNINKMLEAYRKEGADAAKWSRDYILPNDEPYTSTLDTAMWDTSDSDISIGDSE